MKLIDLLVEKKEPETKGTYAAVKFDEATQDAIVKYIEDNDIPNGLSKSKLHTTLLYSRKYCPNYEPAGDIDPAWVGKPTKLEVWESKGKLRDEPTTRCLVLKFNCPEMDERHKELMAEHDATYDFPEYKTHVTLSYDIGVMDESKLPSPTDAIGDLTIVEEYGEDLQLDWAKTNT